MVRAFLAEIFEIGEIFNIMGCGLVIFSLVLRPFFAYWFVAN